jgi:hypothetical protein
LKKILLFFLIISSLSEIHSLDKESSNKAESLADRYKDILSYGIESEVADILQYLGSSPKVDFYPLLLERYQASSQADFKSQLIDYFSGCDNLPENITQELYEEAKNAPNNFKLHSRLLVFLGKKGKTEQQELLIERLDGLNESVKNISSIGGESSCET